MIKLNETSADIWRWIDEGLSREDVISRFADTYNVSEEIATGLSTLMTSTDMVNWTDTGRSPITGEARTELLTYTSNWWAPCVVKIGDKWVLYISLFVDDDHCRIAVMDSSAPEGPFEWRGFLLDGVPDFGVANAIDPFTL